MKGINIFKAGALALAFMATTCLFACNNNGNGDNDNSDTTDLVEENGMYNDGTDASGSTNNEMSTTDNTGQGIDNGSTNSGNTNSMNNGDNTNNNGNSNSTNTGTGTNRQNNSRGADSANKNLKRQGSIQENY